MVAGFIGVYVHAVALDAARSLGREERGSKAGALAFGEFSGV
jgi:hypothetical protein